METIRLATREAEALALLASHDGAWPIYPFSDGPAIMRRPGEYLAPGDWLALTVAEVERLERAGLVERVVGADGRAAYWTITEAGRARCRDRGS
jgi:hypothetical protein